MSQEVLYMTSKLFEDMLTFRHLKVSIISFWVYKFLNILGPLASFDFIWGQQKWGNYFCGIFIKFSFWLLRAGCDWSTEHHRPDKTRGKIHHDLNLRIVVEELRLGKIFHHTENGVRIISFLKEVYFGRIICQPFFKRTGDRNIYCQARVWSQKSKLKGLLGTPSKKKM